MSVVLVFGVVGRLGGLGWCYDSKSSHTHDTILGLEIDLVIQRYEGTYLARR